MREFFREDAEDRIGVTVFCLILLGYALFWVGFALCAVKLMWWILFVL